MAYIKPSIYDTTTFNLKITGLSKLPPRTGTNNSEGVVSNPNGLSDVVYKVFWILTGTEETDIESKTGSTLLDTTDLTSENMIDFDKLTNEIVSGWLIDSEPFIAHKYTICNNILEKRAVENTSVPW
tara:strand:- start:1747 stop:2127 length:381 start_codon:yes stop_codon:yes gene_type:complete